ncbi:RNA polymerase sigma-70 factor (ECF subfamily) [Chitinophaga terrae (ex Kim and Jung 2007)]|uniref:RNA polymerase sigma factor n=1 Tax=Chitinophaga terrae (ex Kim and Jung 2007) TaxID=408074 RepID=UPI00278A5115|nr:sigma-70 family RNA polymerase sigma factor [Chitinophaga terrae (ex Kim and Jung 2007)]MDQ0105907.1 RNA polymerase sigma-70 factor (ECF subfamily) [Chitinophaga terrae (ex Kim and Jung 2007)]
MSGINHNSDRQLLLQISEGDEQAFAMLVKAYSGLLFTYLVKLTKDQDIASDVVQEIFTQLWLTRESLRNVESFRSWLFVISRHHAVRMLKNIDKEYKKREEWHQITQTAADGPEAQDEASLKEAYDILVKNAVDRLPPQQKKVWVLARLEGKKYAEIAEEMQISRETVKKYLQIASSSIVDYIRNNGLPIIISFLIIKL